MKIGILCQFYPPEMEPSGIMFNSLAEQLSEVGNEVTVIAGFSNFPKGVFIDKKKFELYRNTTVGGVNLKYVWLIPSDNVSVSKRILNYTTYMISSFFAGIFSKFDVDVVLATSPPLLAALSGLMISKLKRIPFVLDVRDIWPESAIQLGHLNNKLVVKIAEAIESMCYKHSKKIVVATPGMKRVLVDRGISVDKIDVIPCGLDIEHLVNDDIKSIDNPYDERDQGKFIILYSGLHGIAQGLETILDAAKELENSNDIVFYFVGDGPEKQKLVNRSKDLNLSNLRFKDPVPKKNIGNFIAHANCALVPLKNLEVFETVYPSKTFEFMAWGTPIILGVPGDISEVINTAKCGITVEAENSSQYANAILKLKNSIELQKEYSANGKKYALENFDAKVLNIDYSKILNDVIYKFQKGRKK